MNNQEKYFDRDLSWLSFNHRVLLEAKDESLPLYERLKFLAIFSSNLEEFFRIRVAMVRGLLRLKKKKRREWGLEPKKLMEKMLEEIEQHQQLLGKIYREEILPGLASFNIHLLNRAPSHPEHLRFLNDFFATEVLPNVHPVLLKRGKIVHFLRDRALYLAVGLVRLPKPGDDLSSPKRREYALVQIPTHYFPRFVMLPFVNDRHTIMFLDDVVRYNLEKIFPGYIVENSFSVKLTRDADLQIEDEFTGDLVEKIRRSLRKRSIGLPSRFLFDAEMPEDMQRYLRETFDFGKGDMMPGAKYHSFSDFFGFPNPIAPLLTRKNWKPLRSKKMDLFDNVFHALDEDEYLLHFPYQSYDHVLSFLNQAAVDPHVTSIKTTQYRVANNSAIVNALIRAAQNGKQVTVFVELKARFDEASNLRSSEEMKAAGVKIIYSFPIVKVHAKIALVTRDISAYDGIHTTKYAFLSTGNFNEKTARLYADHGFFTKSIDITEELEEVFSHLEDRNYQPPPFQHLLVAGLGMKRTLIEKIDNEIANHLAGRRAHIILKLNNLEDPVMIDKLYEASQAGVPIDLIIRGICCLRPGVPGLSETISITRIIDRYLEHARVLYFFQGGKEEIFLSSADWMRRNLNRRIEVAFPIYDSEMKAELIHILQIQLDDNTSAAFVNDKLENVRKVRLPGEAVIRAQEATYKLIWEGKLGTKEEVLD